MGLRDSSSSHCRKSSPGLQGALVPGKHLQAGALAPLIRESEQSLTSCQGHKGMCRRAGEWECANLYTRAYTRQVCASCTTQLLSGILPLWGEDAEPLRPESLSDSSPQISGGPRPRGGLFCTYSPRNWQPQTFHHVPALPQWKNASSCRPPRGFVGHREEMPASTEGDQRGSREQEQLPGCLPSGTGHFGRE